MENKEPEKEEKSNNKKGNLTKKLRENPWILSTFVLGIMILILLIGNISVFSGKSVSSNDAGNNLVNYLNKVADSEVTLVSVENEQNMYLVTVGFKGEEIPIYVTKDGKYYTTSLLPIITSSSSNKIISSKPTFTEEQNILIQEFSSCLYNKGMRVYYAGWCGHCHNLIETFGGLKNAGKMMIECQTENGEAGEGADLCEKENIKGFPTIKINGEQYSGSRTFEDFAEATGCTSP